MVCFDGFPMQDVVIFRSMTLLSFSILHEASTVSVSMDNLQKSKNPQWRFAKPRQDG
jgi:hypothetical protein